MKIAHSLYMQTLSMVLFYLMTLCIIVFICFNAQFGIGWEALLKSPFGDRVDTIADAISSNLQAADRKNWTDVLKNFDKLYGVKFYVFSVQGEQLAGPALALPKALADKVLEFPPGMGPGLGPHGMGPGLGPPGMGPEMGPGMGPPEFSHHGMIGMGQPGLNLEGAPHFQTRLDDHWPPPIPFHHSAPSGFRATFEPGEPGPVIGFQHTNAREIRTFHPHPFMHAQGRFIVHTDNPDTFFVGTKVMLFDTRHFHPIPSFVIADTNNIWQNTLLFDFRFLLFTASLILVLSLLFWWPFVHQIARSVGELTAVTQKIADGKFDARIKGNRQDELGRLGDAVNIMAEKLNEYVFAQKRFLADVSHELFSPLARLHMALELLESCKPEDSSRHFKEINEEIDEMKSLITELLAYAKAGLVQSEKQLVKVDLKPIFEDLISKFSDQMDIKVTLDPVSTVEGDATLLSRSLSNIIRNSIRYAGEAGPLTIQSRREGTDLLVSICDCGPGVPDETLKFLGQPFFRPEFSRNRNSGGFGMGLAIVKSCIEACNGTVMLSNIATGGLSVQIRLKSLV
ncbi:MAG: HAMP domain-containing histidine kinase [Cyanobacteria bacterium SZAS-4]|nr:HAMP domain-containing histidine kinase [Cyanobacteria bacterium SZAS-4]